MSGVWLLSITFFGTDKMRHFDNIVTRHHPITWVEYHRTTSPQSEYSMVFAMLIPKAKYESGNMEPLDNEIESWLKNRRPAER